MRQPSATDSLEAARFPDELLLALEPVAFLLGLLVAAYSYI